MNATWTMAAQTGSSSLTEPHRRLMAAVLQAVVADCHAGSRGPGETPSALDASVVRKAEAYVRRTDRAWPFSFENLCESLGLDAAALREELLVPRVAACARSSTAGRRPAAGNDDGRHGA